MPDTGLTAPTLWGSPISGESTNEWIKPDRASIDDTLYATADPSDVGQDGESYEKFGFSIPSTATITGVLISIIAKKAETGNDTKISAQLYHHQGFGRTLQGNTQDVGPWTSTSDQTFTFGGSTELWGTTTLTPTIWNATDTGVFLLAEHATTNGVKLNVDFIQIQVFYTLPGSAGPLVNAPIITQFARMGGGLVQ